MHTVHFPNAAENGVIAAALGIMFSVNNPTVTLNAADTKIIDDFFDTLQWNTVTGTPSVNLVSYGDLMMMVDFNDRWTYKGSVTTPPCARFVYWNVLRKVYPIK